MSCNCGKKINKYIDMSNIEPIDWDEASALWGFDVCGKPTPVNKPEYEFTEEDKEKLDMLVTDGDGKLFLSNDGTYKEAVAERLSSIELFYQNNPVNFVLINNEKLQDIKRLLDDVYEPLVRLSFGSLSLPVSIAYDSSENILTLSYDGFIYQSNGRTILPYERMFIYISLDVSTVPYTVNRYEYTQDRVVKIEVDGDGTKALFDDGNYKTVPTLDIIEPVIDEKINTALEDYYNKDEINEVLEEYITYDEVDKKIENAVFYNDNNDIAARNNIILNNDNKLLGTTLEGSNINLIECSRFTDEGHPIVDISSTSSHITFSAIDRPNVQLQGESGNHNHQMAYLSEVDNVSEAISIESQNRIDADNLLQEQITQNKNEVDSFKDTVNESFLTVTDEVNRIDSRIDNAVTDINKNTSDITSLRNDFNSVEHFRGYYQTEEDLATINNPLNGDYAWLASTGTSWSYNSTTWEDTTNSIPSDAVPASDSIPLIDSDEGNPGTSQAYSRGDHRHPSDTSKADVTELNNYLPLAGNTQTTPMSGDIWLGSSNTINLTDSGNSSIGFSDDDNAIVLLGAGEGGVDIQSPLGTVKANGQRVIVNGNNASPTVIQSSGSRITMSADNTTIEANNMGIEANGAIGLHSYYNITLVSDNGKAFYGVSTNPLNELARISNINDVESELNNYYTKGYIDTALTNKVNVVDLEDNYYNKEEVNESLDLKADVTALSEYVTIDTNQTINGQKRITAPIILNSTSSIFFGNILGNRIQNTSETDLNIQAIDSNDVLINTDSGVLKYNGVEVATVDSMSLVKTYEIVLNGTNDLTLPDDVNEVLYVSFERVLLYSDEYDVTGATLTITATDLDFTGNNRVKIIYK